MSESEGCFREPQGIPTTHDTYNNDELLSRRRKRMVFAHEASDIEPESWTELDAARDPGVAIFVAHGEGSQMISTTAFESLSRQGLPPEAIGRIASSLPPTDALPRPSRRRAA